MANDPLTIIHGDALSSLRALESESVQCCVTSPPYWGLRDYGVEPIVWDATVECDHEWGSTERTAWANAVKGPASFTTGKNQTNYANTLKYHGSWCQSCRAWRGCLGLEPTPELYVLHMVEIFRELKRVFRSDGTLWLNLGDSYATGGGAVGRCPGGGEQGERFLRQGHVNTQPNRMPIPGLKPKDLVGIPWAVATALRDPYYAGRIKSERDRSWMAAMMDGEGTICGFKHERKDDGRTRTGINICVTNSNTALLDECYRIWHVSRSEHNTHGDGHLGDLPTYRWIVHGTANKLLFLREIYPYLIAKKRQALLAYNLLLFSFDAKRLGKTPQKDEVNRKREVLTALISDANNVRPLDIPSWCIEPPSVWEHGWYLRSDIIWGKPNPMPESVTDRPTKAHEYIFLLSKSERYFYDASAIAESGAVDTPARMARAHKGYAPPGQPPHSGVAAPRPNRSRVSLRPHESFNNKWDAMSRAEQCSGFRNKRSVWTVATSRFPDAHFATFPTEIPTIVILARQQDR